MLNLKSLTLKNNTQSERKKVVRLPLSMRLIIYSMWIAIAWFAAGSVSEAGYSYYFGDLHAHSVWSGDAITSEIYEESYELDHACDYADGNHIWDCLETPLSRLLSLFYTYHYGILQAKLDFVAITDHIETGHHGLLRG